MMRNGSLVNNQFKFLEQQISDNKGIIKYCQEKIDSDIAAWEKKEYLAVMKSAQKALAVNEENLKNLQQYA